MNERDFNLSLRSTLYEGWKHYNYIILQWKVYIFICIDDDKQHIVLFVNISFYCFYKEQRYKENKTKKSKYH